MRHCLFIKFIGSALAFAICITPKPPWLVTSADDSIKHILLPTSRDIHGVFLANIATVCDVRSDHKPCPFVYGLSLAHPVSFSTRL